MAKEYEKKTHRKKSASVTLPVDRGWAWVILAASVVNEFLIIGTIKSFGILLVEFLEIYQQSIAVTSLLAGLLYGTYSFISLMILTRVEFLSSRQCVIIGGFLTTSSCVISTFAKDIYFLVFTLSIIFGIGAGLVSGPTLVILGRYFKKRRSTVNLIVMTSGSLGGVVIAPLCRSLIDTYTIQGALFIVGGLVMHVMVSGALMRPIDFFKPRKKEKKQDPVLKPLINENMDGLAPRSLSLSDSTYSPLARRAMLYRMRSRTETECSDTVPHSVDDDVLISIHKQSMKEQNNMLEAIEEIKSKKKLRKVELSVYSCQGDMINIALSDMKFRRKTKSKTKDHTNKVFENGYSKDDISGSKSSKVNEKDDMKCCKQLFDTKLFKNRTFNVFLCVSALGLTALNYQLIFLPLFASDMGQDGQSLAVLIITTCLGDCASRILFGVLSTKKLIPSNFLIVVSLIVTGVLNSLTGAYSEYWMLVLYSVIHGLFGAVMLSVYFGDFCRQVGPKIYTQGLPIIMMGQAVLQVAFAVVFGLLRDKTTSYVTSYYLIGASLFLSAVLYSLENFMAFIKTKRSKNKNEKSDSELSDLNVPVVYHNRRRRSSI